LSLSINLRERGGPTHEASGRHAPGLTKPRVAPGMAHSDCVRFVAEFHLYLGIEQSAHRL